MGRNSGCWHAVTFGAAIAPDAPGESERSSGGGRAPAKSYVDTPTADEADALLDRCRAGDPSAWAALVNRYERLVFAVALRNGLSREDAADVTQTTFTQLLRSIDSIEQGERLAAWLMTVARRQSWKHAKQRDGNPAAIPEHLATPDATGDWESTAVLRESVELLGDPCSQLIYWLYLDPTNPSYADIAERLGRRVGGIGPLRGRCLERLRQVLGDAFD